MGPPTLAVALGVVFYAVLSYGQSGGPSAGTRPPDEALWIEAASSKATTPTGSMLWHITGELLLVAFIIFCIRPFILLAWNIWGLHIRDSGEAMLPLQTEPAAVKGYGSFAFAADKKRSSLQFPLSTSQEYMVMWQQLHPQGVAYNECFAVWLEGFVAQPALKEACLALLERQSALRSLFKMSRDGSWSQELQPSAQALQQAWVEAACIGDEVGAVALADRAFHTPLDIFKCSSIRFGLVCCSPAKALFYVVQHHAVTDGVSIPLLYNQLSSHYIAACAGNAVSKPVPFPRSFCDVATSSRGAIADNKFDVSRRWWREHLRGHPEGGSFLKLDLPADRPKSAPSFTAERVTLDLPPGMSDQLISCAKAEGVTLFDLLLALHSCWLCKTASCPAVVVGVPHHGRTGQNADGLLGCFITMMALRLQPQGSFWEFVQVAARTKRDGVLRADIPPMLLFESASDGTAGRSDVPYQNLLSYHSDRYNVAGIEHLAKAPFGPNLCAKLVHLQPRCAKLDIEVIFTKGEGLRGEIIFAADLFSQAACSRITKQFLTLMSAALADLHTGVHELPLMSADEELQLKAFHGVSLPQQQSAPELLQAAAAAFPLNTAVELDSGAQLSYAELRGRVHGLAACLAAKGVGPEVLVALLMERSSEMVVAVHGVMASGGAFVPMDISSPIARLEVIVEDLQSHNAGLPNASGLVLLTQNRILKSFNEKGDLLLRSFSHMLTLDTFKPLLEEGSSWTFSAPHPDSLCYALYTSGSTGRPKGVLLRHGGLANYIANRQLETPLSSQDVIMQKTPYTLDVSLHEFVWPLIAAAKLHVVKHDGHKDPQYLAEVIRHKNVTVAHFVPSFLIRFLDVLQANNKSLDLVLASKLRMVNCSGEALSADNCRAFFGLLPEVELHDLYGPTEATVEVTHLTCTAALFRGEKSIGRPFQGVNAYVVLPDTIPLRRAPIGIRGELLLGGVQVARGYLNRPEKSAEAFVADPFADDGRLYHTGDLVKWREDGHIVYLGRIDRQVKLNGIRIELGELEAAAVHTAGVQEAVAKLCKDSDGAHRLAVYVLPASIEAKAVLKQCRLTLPAYMVPSVVIGVQAWPRTSTGKIDHDALAPPPGGGAAAVEDGAPVKKPHDELKAWLQPETSYDCELGACKATVESTRTACPLAARTDAEVASQDGVIASLGHIRFFVMCLVLLEWLQGYWEWYGVVPALTHRFGVHEFPLLEQLASLGRFLGDPCFVMLAGIQDMSAVADGNTAQLFRDFVMFATVAVVGTLVNSSMLQGPYTRHGWCSHMWAMNTTQEGGVLNGAAFIYARALFLPFAMLLSKRCPCGWISNGFIDWPWAGIALAFLVPMLAEGLDPNGNSFDPFGFIRELCPYYFLYPLCVGGINFPGWISRRKVKSSWSACGVVTLTGICGTCQIIRNLGIVNAKNFNTSVSNHVIWRQSMEAVVGSVWGLSHAVKYCDLYSAIVASLVFICFAMASPVVPSMFSLLGTRVLGSYLTLPITLTAAGHFFGLAILDITGPWRVTLITTNVIILTIFIVAVTSQPPPDWALQWMADGSNPSWLQSAMHWISADRPWKRLSRKFSATLY